MKKIIVFTFIFCLILILSGCYLSGDYPEFRKLTAQCVEEKEDKLKELYNICEKNNLEDISRFSNDNEDKGIVIDWNGNKYFVVTPDGKNANPSKKEYLQACEILDKLISDYSVKFIIYYPDLKKMEIWFSENFIDADWGITYYPPDVTPPKDIVDREHSEAIKDGFYTYLWLKGF